MIELLGAWALMMAVVAAAGVWGRRKNRAGRATHRTVDRGPGR